MRLEAILSRLGSQYLPHISRIFSAGVVKKSFVGALVALYVTMWYANVLLQKQENKNYVSARNNVLTSPFDEQSYINFGQYLYDLGQKELAKKQLALAVQVSRVRPFNIPPSSTVLGVATSPTDVSNRWEYESATNERATQYWKNVVMKQSNYRDGYVQLAMIAYEEKRIDEAKLYLEQARLLDPNNEQIQELWMGMK